METKCLDFVNDVNEEKKSAALGTLTKIDENMGKKRRETFCNFKVL